MFRRKRTAHAAEELIRIRISSETPDVYKCGYREYLLTPHQANELLFDLRAAMEAPPWRD